MLDATFQVCLINIDLNLRKISEHLERIAKRLDSWNTRSLLESTAIGKNKLDIFTNKNNPILLNFLIGLWTILAVIKHLYPWNMR